MHVIFFWPDALRNYFYYVWIYLLLGFIYCFSVITVLLTFGMLLLIPPFLVIAVFQVNTWTVFIMRHLLLKNQTWLARKIDETYKIEILNSIKLISKDDENEFDLFGFSGKLIQLLMMLTTSFFPLVPQLLMIPSISWQYLNAIYLPKELPDDRFWKNKSSFLSFGLMAACLEAIPFVSGLTFTTNYLGGTMMAVDMDELHFA